MTAPDTVSTEWLTRLHNAGTAILALAALLGPLGLFMMFDQGVSWSGTIAYWLAAILAPAGTTAIRFGRHERRIKGIALSETSADMERFTAGLFLAVGVIYMTVTTLCGGVLSLLVALLGTNDLRVVPILTTFSPAVIIGFSLGFAGGGLTPRW